MSKKSKLNLTFKRLTKKFIQSDNQNALAALWAARIVQTAAHLKVRRYRHLDADELLLLLELFNLKIACPKQEKDTDFLDDLEMKDLVQALRKTLTKPWVAKLEAAASVQGVLAHNLAQLEKTLGLTQVEVQLLAFFILLEMHSGFKEWCDNLQDFNHKDAQSFLSKVLNISSQDLAQALSKDAALFKAGIFELNIRNNQDNLDRLIDLVDGFAYAMTDKKLPANKLLEAFFTASTPAQLTTKYFAYVNFTQPLVSYLKKTQGRQGVNILVYGEPGTGKTEWTKAIAKAVKMELFEVNNEDIKGESLNPADRVRVYGLAQQVLRQQTNSLIMFDEVEDVFASQREYGYNDSGSLGKAWFNKQLENNPVPAFWLTNSLAKMDNAYLRRFDMVVEIKAPPASVRKDILTKLLTGVNVTEAWINTLAKEKSLVPAVMERAIKVAKTIYTAKTPSAQIEEQILNLINSTHQAQGKALLVLSKHKSAVSYSLNYINTSANLPKLVAGLKAKQTGRLCLYGLPGTGKTAFGYYLAEELELPLIIKRASDLLSPYVGEAEMNIAAAFREAASEGAILQIDECDSFLQDREKAQRSWEITQVNEFLTQMEAFEGIFIASTNLVKDLDAASMRRFDLKLEFKPLTNDQSLQMFESILLDKNISLKNKHRFKQQLASLNVLTPGDFAAVERKFSLGFAELEPENLLEALEEECSFKPNFNKSQGIGFHVGLKRNRA